MTPEERTVKLAGLREQIIAQQAKVELLIDQEPPHRRLGNTNPEYPLNQAVKLLNDLRDEEYRLRSAPTE